MTELYIIAGIIGYLLIGVVLGGVAARMKQIGEELIVGFIIGWPMLLIAFTAFGIVSACSWLAKKIGGVK